MSATRFIKYNMKFFLLPRLKTLVSAQTLPTPDDECLNPFQGARSSEAKGLGWVTRTSPVRERHERNVQFIRC